MPSSELDVITLANRHEELCGGSDGSSKSDGDDEGVPVALDCLRSVVGKPFTHRAIMYEVVACLTANEDVEPAYQLHFSEGKKQYVSLSDLQIIMGDAHFVDRCCCGLGLCVRRILPVLVIDVAVCTAAVYVASWAPPSEFLGSFGFILHGAAW